MITDDDLAPDLAARRAKLFAGIREHLLDPDGVLMFATPLSAKTERSDITRDLGVGDVSGLPQFYGIAPDIVVLSHLATAERAEPIKGFVSRRDQEAREAASRALKLDRDKGAPAKASVGATEVGR